MTPELTNAAQQALEALKHGVAQLNGIGIPLEADPLHTAITAIERALTQRPAAQADDWRTPTTYAQRFSEAVALLCREMPPADMVAAWIDRSSDDHRLQDWACERAPSWAQGIGLLDAAHVMADQPTEGVDHEPTPQQATPDLADGPAPTASGWVETSAPPQRLDWSDTQQATPEPVEYKCRHCGVTTIEDEEGVTMHGLPAPERPIMFDPSADVPIPATPEPVGWTDADADAARLAMELECLLLDTKDTAAVSRWWKSANEALDLHRARLAATQAKQ